MTGKILPLTSRKAVWVRASHNLVLHVPSGMYYVRKRKKGKADLFATTGHKVKARAQAEADLRVAEWLGLKHSGRSVRISELCDELLAALEKQTQPDAQGRTYRRASTHAKDKWYLPKIKELFGDSYVDEVDEDFFETWCDGPGRELGRSLFDFYKYLSKMLTYAHRKKLLIRRPYLKNPDEDEKGGAKYTDEQVQAFIDHSKGDLRDLILLISENPLRPWETKRLRWDQLLFARREVTLTLETRHTKNKKRRELRLSRNSFKLLKRRKAEAQSEFVFPSPADPAKPVGDVRVGRWWRIMLGKAKQPMHFRFHWLRHTFYSRAIIDAKLDIQTVSEAGGTSIKTLQKRYLHASAESTKAVAGVVNLKFSGEKTVKSKKGSK